MSKKRIKRSGFDLSHERLLTCNMGYLIPILVEEVLPSDHFKVSTEALIRFAPMLKPVMSSINSFLYYFYVPNRIIDPKWEDYISGYMPSPTVAGGISPQFGTPGNHAGTTGDDFGAPATFKFSGSFWTAGDPFSDGSLADYIGCPRVNAPVFSSNSISMTAYPFLAYQKIYNEYFRDEMLQPEVIDEWHENMSDTEIQDAVTLRKKNWEKDYFTTSGYATMIGNMNYVRIPVYGAGSGGGGVVPGTITFNSASGTGIPYTPSGLSVASGTIPITIPGYQGTAQVDGYTGTITVPGYSGSLDIPGYSGSLNIPGYQGNVTLASSQASATVPSQDASIIVPGGSYDVTVPAHGVSVQYPATPFEGATFGLTVTAPVNVPAQSVSATGVVQGGVLTARGENPDSHDQGKYNVQANIEGTGTADLTVDTIKTEEAFLTYHPMSDYFPDTIDPVYDYPRFQNAMNNNALWDAGSGSVGFGPQAGRYDPSSKYPGDVQLTTVEEGYNFQRYQFPVYGGPVQYGGSHTVDHYLLGFNPGKTLSVDSQTFDLSGKAQVDIKGFHGDIPQDAWISKLPNIQIGTLPLSDFTGQVKVDIPAQTVQHSVDIPALDVHGLIDATVLNGNIPSQTVAVTIPPREMSVPIASQTFGITLPGQSAPFTIPADTSNFTIPADTSNFTIPADTVPFTVPSDQIQFTIPQDTTSGTMPSRSVTGSTTLPNQWHVSAFSPDTSQVQNLNDEQASPVIPTSYVLPEDIRSHFAIQRFFEKGMRYGVRYIEQIKAHFGVHTGDARLQRPEFLGAGKTPVVVSEVLQTSATSGTAVLAQQAGHGIASGKHFAFSKTFREHGYIIGILCVSPRSYYYQGLSRHLIKRSVFDYAFPDFAHLGEQPVYNEELYAYNGDDFTTFGYQPRYQEYRKRNSTIHGDFRNTLDNWHFGRKFSDKPNLNSAFVTQNVDSRPFAQTDQAIHRLWIHLRNNVLAVRPLPKTGVPGLVDHN